MRSSHLGAFAALGLLLAMPAFAQTAPASGAATTVQAAAPASSASHDTLIDINSASKGELTELPQIGPARAEAIIKHRPYREKSDLADKKIVPQGTYDAIKDRIIAHQKS